MATMNHDFPVEGSPHRNTLALTEWRPILHASNQVVLYNPTSHAISIQQSSASVVRRNHANDLCPYCHRRLRAAGGEESIRDAHTESDAFDYDLDEDMSSRVPNYFQLLQVANETASIPSTPRGSRTPSVTSDPSDLSNSGSSSVPRDGGSAFRAGAMAEGYFKTFFQEECRLGMGANGTVYLCQVGRHAFHEWDIFLHPHVPSMRKLANMHKTCIKCHCVVSLLCSAV